MQQSTRTSGHVPGETGIWVMIGGDLLIFALFFGTYLYYAALEPAVFAGSQAVLSQPIGLLNTLFLLTSSWTAAQAVQAVRAGERARARPLLRWTLLFALLFLVDKGIEWSLLIREGHTLLSSNYFMFFFMLTGIHALHVVIGMGILLYLHGRLGGNAHPLDRDLSAMESGASFWHLVDLLWIVLFALLYLVR